jgi:hypothetical protein
VPLSGVQWPAVMSAVVNLRTFGITNLRPGSIEGVEFSDTLCCHQLVSQDFNAWSWFDKPFL